MYFDINSCIFGYQWEHDLRKLVCSAIKTQYAPKMLRGSFRVTRFPCEMTDGDVLMCREKS